MISLFSFEQAQVVRMKAFKKQDSQFFVVEYSGTKCGLILCIQRIWENVQNENQGFASIALI
jgi:hypothetical protein